MGGWRTFSPQNEALGPEAFDRAWLKARPLLGTPLADAIDEAGGIVEKAAAEDDAVDADAWAAVAPVHRGEIRAVEKRMSMALKSRSRTVWTQTMAVDRIVPLDQLVFYSFSCFHCSPRAVGG